MSGVARSGGQRVDRDDRDPAAGQRHRVGQHLGRDGGREDDGEGAGRDVVPQLGAQPLLVADRAVGHADPGEDVEQPAQVVARRRRP